MTSKNEKTLNQKTILRDLVFVRIGGTLAEGLGISPERLNELDRFTNQLIQQGASLRDYVEALNARGDLTDAEWTAAMYSMGYYQGERASR